MSRIRANQITNQSADGAPTVQNGLVISGVTTSTTFSGSGASLTNLPSAQLTGALPALDGSNLTGITQTTINNNADNRVITGSGTANTLEGESGLTYSSNTLDVNNAVKLPDDGTVHFGVSDTAYVRGKDSTDGYVKIGTVGAEVAIFTPEKTIRTNQCPALETTAGAINITGGASGGRIALQGTTTSAGGGLAEIFAFWGTNKVAGIIASSGSDTTNKDDGQLLFYTSASGPAVTERLRITSGGQVCIGTDTAVRALTIKQPGQIHLESTDTGNWLGVSLKGSSGTNNYNAYFGMLDSNGNFFIDNGSNGNDFVITQSGQVTKPSQASFAAYVGSNPYSLNNQVFPFNNTKHNIGSHFNTSNHRFTAPVAGRYLFNFHSIYQSNGQQDVQIRVNNSSSSGMMFHVSQNGSNWDQASCSYILNLNANDYVTMWSVSNTGWHGNNWGMFSGELLS